jgi:nicotinate dehydrogenase subunit B
MTGFLHEKEFSRKSFIVGSGALVTGLSIADAAEAATGNTPFGNRTPADFIDLGDPRLTQVDTWIAISPQNKVIVTHGQTEFSGTPTGILMLAGEELNIDDMSMLVYAHPESWLNSVGGGGGSGGIATRSTVCRAAAAQAMKLLLNAASTQLGVPVSGLSAKNGVISGGGKTVKYSDLYGGKLFNFDLATLTPAVTTTTGYIPGAGNTKPVSQYQLAGKLKRRIDIPDKVAGTYTYIHNVRIAGMVHARRVRPRGAGANTSQNHFPLTVDASSIAHIPGAQVVQIGNFLAIVAPKEYDAIQAAAQLKVVWKDDPKFGDGGSGNYWSWLRKAGDTNTVNPARWTADTGGVDAAMASAAKTVSATYHYHYNTFANIGPHCAIADVDVKNGRAVVYAAGQAVGAGQGGPGGAPPPQISTVLAGLNPPVNIPANQIRTIWYESSGSYGGGQTVQAAEEAAVISATIGKPVRMQWMRWDQQGWDNWGPAHMYDAKMGADSTGRIVASDWTSYGQAGTQIDTMRELLGQVTWAANPGSGGPAPSDGGAIATPYGNTNYGSAYQFKRRVLAKSQPLYGGALKISALRAPNTPQSYFASEQIVDELAYALGVDPVTFRKQNIDATSTLGARWLAVLDAAVIAHGYKPRVAFKGGPAQTGDDIRKGTGIALSTFASSQACCIVDVEVNLKTGKIVAKHATITQNNGITVNLEGVTNQMSGAFIQGLSRALYEQATWNKDRITNLDWVSYPILRFKDSPTVTLVNVHPGKYTVVKPGDESLSVQAGNTEAFNEGWVLSGSGEPPTGPAAAAVANAFFDATGVRIRQTPMNPVTVRNVLKDAGVA